MSILVRTVRALTLALPFCLAGPAQAAPISYNFSGEWFAVDPLLSSQFGQTFGGSFTYESSTPPIGNAHLAFYNAVTAFSLTTGSYTATLSSPSGVPLSIEISVSGLDCQNFNLLNLSAMNGLSGPPVDGFPLVGAELDLADCETSPLVSAIPLPTSIDFHGFSELRLHLGGGALGRLTSLTLVPTIPEPTALALYVIGGGVFALFQRRKRATPRAVSRVRVGRSK
jgi:hypothetical protein